MRCRVGVALCCTNSAASAILMRPAIGLTAIYEGHEDRVREMLGDDSSLARAEYAYLQPLHYAVKAGRIGMVELLLAAGANPLAEGWSGRPLGDDTPLARARDREQVEIVRLLED